VLGLWGRIIELDTATFISFSLIINLGIDFIEANAMKSALCLIFCFFALNDDNNWIYGGTLAVGSFLAD